MIHKVNLRFADKVTREIAVEHGANLLQAALNAGVMLAHQCRAGSCTSCVYRCVSGEFAMESGRCTALLPHEVAAGSLLACLTRVDSDGVVEFPYESTFLDRHSPVRFEAKIRSAELLSVNIMKLVIESRDAPEFRGGSYFMLSVPGTEAQRAYSPFTRSADLPVLAFLIRLVPDGVISTYLRERAERGARLHIVGPFGDFHWTDNPAALVLIAGGTGLAPLLSILDTIAAERRHRNKILLCFGVNNSKEIFFLDELALRQELMPRLEVRVAVLNATGEWDGAVGHVTDLLSPVDANESAQAYICGPPPMVAAGVERLLGFGVSSNNIHFEPFGASTGQD